MMSSNAKHVKLADAKQASKCAEARLWGMKYRAERNPPKAATGGFPYPARTCAEWAFPDDVMLRPGSRHGAAMLLKAVTRMAA